MRHTHFAWKSILAFLCIAFLLAYIFATFFPHAHHYQDHDCALCAVLQSSQEIWITLSLCAFLSLAAIEFKLTHPRERLFVLRETTLVGLKVKLSD